MHRADIQPLDKACGADQVVGADTRGQAEGCAVGNRYHSVVIVRHAEDRHDRPEGFFHHQFAVMRHAVDVNWR